MTGIVVELLHTEGCPNALEYPPQLRRLAATAGVDAPVTVRLITDAEQAHDEAFLGSPTVQVNGRDVDPGAATRTEYGLSRRLYPEPDGRRGTLPDAWVIALLRPATLTAPPTRPAPASARSTTPPCVD